MAGFRTEQKRTGLGPQVFPEYQRHFAAFGRWRQKNRTCIGPHPRQQKFRRFQLHKPPMSGVLNLGAGHYVNVPVGWSM